VGRLPLQHVQPPMAQQGPGRSSADEGRLAGLPSVDGMGALPPGAAPAPVPRRVTAVPWDYAWRPRAAIGRAARRAPRTSPIGRAARHAPCTCGLPAHEARRAMRARPAQPLQGQPSHGPWVRGWQGPGGSASTRRACCTRPAACRSAWREGGAAGGGASLRQRHSGLGLMRGSHGPGGGAPGACAQEWGRWHVALLLPNHPRGCGS
jgi:hypothetical protein